MNETQPGTKERLGERAVILGRARPAGNHDKGHHEAGRGESCSSDGPVVDLSRIVISSTSTSHH